MFSTLTRLTHRLGRSALALPLAVLLAGLIIVVSEMAFNGADDQLSRLVLMGRVRLQITLLLQRITDAESGQRGYLLTSGNDYLAPYRDANLDAQRAIGDLQGLYRQLGDSASQSALHTLAQDVQTKLSELNAVLMMHDAGRTTAAVDLMRSGIGRERMESIRNQANALLDAENQRIVNGLAEVFSTLRQGRAGVAVLTLLGLLMLVLFLRQGRQMDRQRALQQARVLAERDRLEAEVRARTHELIELARHLETTREDERARLARDLHDELGALLTAAKLDLARMRPKLQQDLPELLPRIGHLVETLNSGIALKRRIIEDLRPSSLDNLGLLPALEVLCADFADRLGVPVITQLEPVRLTASADLTVFRLVQESLNNIAKYANATEVQVCLQDRGATASITVRDNGLGFDTALPGLARHGLVGMRYRVEAEQGQFSLHSAPGQGTALGARLPQQAPPGPDSARPAAADPDPSAAANAAAARARPAQNAQRAAAR